MDHSSTFLGSSLLADLRSSDGMTEKEGQEWIAKKSGRPYDAHAMYKLACPDEEDPKTWREYTDLRIHVMSDAELNALEIEYRRQHKLAPRRPWEPHLFESARGRAER